MASCRFGPYFVSPVIAGLEPDGSVYLAGTDSIGAIETAKDFMVSGTAPESLMGVCEAMWRPGLVRKCSVIDCLVFGIMLSTARSVRTASCCSTRRSERTPTGAMHPSSLRISGRHMR